MPNGSLRIVDRMKHFFKLAQGDFVAPERIEGVYTQLNFISQIFVTGRSTESFMVGVAVVNAELIKSFLLILDLEEILSQAPSSWLNLKVIRQAVLTRMRSLDLVNDQLSKLEQLGNLWLIEEEFTLEGGLLTPTMKLRRRELQEKFNGEIVRMYEEGILEEA